MGFSPFRSDSVTFQASLAAYPPCAPTDAVAGYVVKAHFPLGPDDVSPAQEGSFFVFSWSYFNSEQGVIQEFSSRTAPQILRRYKQRIQGRSLTVNMNRKNGYILRKLTPITFYLTILTGANGH